MFDTTEVPTFPPDDPALRSRPSNPLRIGLIGSDHVQVFIRPAHGEHELLALVDRLERLIDAGYETVDVVFETASSRVVATPDLPVRSVRDSVLAGRDTGVFTDATTSPAMRR